MKTAQDIIDEAAYLRTKKSSLATFFQEVVDFVLPDKANVTQIGRAHV